MTATRTANQARRAHGPNTWADRPGRGLAKPTNATRPTATLSRAFILQTRSLSEHFNWSLHSILRMVTVTMSMVLRWAMHTRRRNNTRAKLTRMIVRADLLFDPRMFRTGVCRAGARRNHPWPIRRLLGHIHNGIPRLSNCYALAMICTKGWSRFRSTAHANLSKPIPTPLPESNSCQFDFNYRPRRQFLMDNYGSGCRRTA